MSTKIYNGIKFHDPSIIKIKDFLCLKRKQYRDVVSGFMRKDLGKMIVDHIDGESLGFPSELDGTGNLLYRAKEKLKKESVKPSDYFNYESKIYIFPCNHELTLGYYSFPNLNERKLYPHLVDDEIFTSYGYWDNSDRPDSVTEEEWKKRKDEWETTLAPSWNIHECGFCSPLFNDFDFILYTIGWDEVLDLIPSYEERMDRAAKRLSEKIALSKLGLNPSMSQVVRALTEASSCEEIKTTAYKEACEKLSKEIDFVNIRG